MKRLNVLLVLGCALLCSMPAMAAKCVISQFGTMARASNNADVPVSGAPTTADIAVTYTTSTQSAVFNSNTRYITFVCDAKAHFLISTSPTATANHLWIGPDQPYSIGVWATGMRIAFYDGSS